MDICCIKLKNYPSAFLELGGHLDDWLGEHDLVLHRTLVMGYPPIPFSDRPTLVAAIGEINALIDNYLDKRVYFIISTIPRGGFSGAPAIVAYNEDNFEAGTAVLGVITNSLVGNSLPTELGFMAVLSVESIYTCLEHNKILPKEQRWGPFKNE